MDKLFPPPVDKDHDHGSVTVSVTQNRRVLDHVQSEPLEEEHKNNTIEKRKTISDRYLLRFESLRDFVQPADEEEQEEDDDDDESRPKKVQFPRPSPMFFVTETVKMNASNERKKVFLFKLNIFERIFLTLHRPTSSTFSKIVSNFMMIVIIISCVFFVISSDPDVKSTPSSCPNPVCENDPLLCPGETMCEPVEPAWFFSVELTCIVIFTIDYVLRVGIVAFVPPRLSNMVSQNFDAIHMHDPYQLDPKYSKGKILCKYTTNIMNIIDLVAILPFYVGLLTNTQSSVSVIRILRLGRMMRVFKVGKYNVGTRLLVATIKESMPALSLLMFFTMLLVVLFGSLVFFAEGGEYTISAEYPDGAYLRTNLFANGKEQSPFLSIVVSCWWVVVTMTTVGYGDLYPTTPFGRLMGVCCMLIGILALALPIGVMGSSFNRNYAKFHGSIEDSMRTSQNVSGMPCLNLKDGDVVYELNNEVVVRGHSDEDDDDDDSASGKDIFDDSPDNSKGAIGMTSNSTVAAFYDSVLPDNKKNKSGGSMGEGEDVNSEHDQTKVNAKMKKSSTSSNKLSNKDIRKRLQVLSGEISFLMNALDDNNEE